MSALADKEVNTRQFFDDAETELEGTLGDIPEDGDQDVLDGAQDDNGELSLKFFDDEGEDLKL